MTIKEARLSAGLTQKQMSEFIEVPLRTIEDWESGKRKPPEYVVSLIIYRLTAEGYQVGGEKETNHDQ